MDRFIRITTTGKPLADIDQGIVDAIERGSRVLVKVNAPATSISSTSISDRSKSDRSKIGDDAIAHWAEGLSQEHGLVWQRVGPDVLFTKLNIPG